MYLLENRSPSIPCSLLLFASVKEYRGLFVIFYIPKMGWHRK